MLALVLAFAALVNAAPHGSPKNRVQGRRLGLPDALRPFAGQTLHPSSSLTSDLPSETLLQVFMNGSDLELEPPSTTATPTSTITSASASAALTAQDEPLATTVFTTVTVAVTPDPVVIFVTKTVTPSSVTPAAVSTSIQTSSAPASTTPAPPSPISSTSSSKPPAPSPGLSHGRNRTEPFVAGYYPDWTSEEFPPERVDFKRFDWMDFAFAVPNATFHLNFDQDNSGDLLHRLTKLAHTANKRVKLSIGGWGGSKYFSKAVSTEPNRQLFASRIVAIYDEFGIDGIDIDWEYPGTSRSETDAVNPADSANFMIFLQTLRTMLPDTAYITAATAVMPFIGPDGQPLKDVSGFAAVLDYIVIMNYDVWGSSSNPGPNSPLNNACGNSTQPNASAQESVAGWVAAEFPANQIMLGTPSYGYIQMTAAVRLIQRDNLAANTMQAFADPATIVGALSVAAAPPVNDNSKPVLLMTGAGDDSSQIQFVDLIRQGALVRSNSTGKYEGAGGFVRSWDACSSTPYLRSESQGQVVTYDDPTSLRLKGEFAKGAGIAGVTMWEVHGDTEDWALTDSLRSGLGLAPVN